MSNRMRIIGWQVQPVLMSDDGDNLTPLNTQAQMIPIGQWKEFKDGGDETALEQMRKQVESPVVDEASTV